MSDMSTTTIIILAVIAIHLIVGFVYLMTKVGGGKVMEEEWPEEEDYLNKDKE